MQPCLLAALSACGGQGVGDETGKATALNLGSYYGKGSGHWPPVHLSHSQKCLGAQPQLGPFVIRVEGPGLLMSLASLHLEGK